MSRSKTKKEKDFQEMIATCVKNSKKRKKSKLETKKWQLKYIESLQVNSQISLSNNISGNCFKKDIQDSKWKKMYEGELLEREKLAQIEVEKKKSKISLAYSKGPVMYIANDEDLKNNGRRPPTY